MTKLLDVVSIWFNDPNRRLWTGFLISDDFSSRAMSITVVVELGVRY